MKVRRPKQNRYPADVIFYRNNNISKSILKILLMVLLAFLIGVANAEKTTPRITVYKSPTCGCCDKWITHLEQNGFIVEAHNSKDMRAIKQKIGVKPQYQSCHTGLINGYYIEGHVPAQDIKKLLVEKPKAAGLSVPRMPMGSPGMEGHRKDPYSVYIIQENGESKVYNNY